MQIPARVLFVCIGNSCRSQMAEGFARARYDDLMEAASAGVQPAPIVQPETIDVMARGGVSLDGQAAKNISEIDCSSIDLVVNMSGLPVLEAMPGFKGLNLMWAVEDPIGKPDKVYVKVRDRIEGLVDDLAQTLRNRFAASGA